MVAVKRLAHGLLKAGVGDVRCGAFLDLPQVLPAETAQLKLVPAVEAGRCPHVRALTDGREDRDEYADHDERGRRGRRARLARDPGYPGTDGAERADADADCHGRAPEAVAT